MNAQTLRDALSAQPFAPFRVVLSTGESFEIRHPEMAWVLQTNLLVGFEESEVGIPARFHTISLLHVARLEPMDAVAN